MKIMNRKSTLLLLVVGLLFVALPSAVRADVVPFDASLPTILMGEMWFAVPGGPQVSYPPGTPPESILTLTGAASGELKFNVSNVGAAVLHEIRSPLFMAAKEVKVLLYDADDNFIAEFEATDSLEVELEVGFKATFIIQLAGAVKKGYQKDPSLSLDYEISCHVEGHYEAGMRALVTLEA